MPDLILHFDLKLLTDPEGVAIPDPITTKDQEVPVLRLATAPGGSPPGSAFCSPAGWRNPVDGSLYTTIPAYTHPPSDPWGEFLRDLRNDLLEMGPCT